MFAHARMLLCSLLIAPLLACGAAVDDPAAVDDAAVVAESTSPASPPPIAASVDPVPAPPPSSDSAATTAVEAADHGAYCGDWKGELKYCPKGWLCLYPDSNFCEESLDDTYSSYAAAAGPFCGRDVSPQRAETFCEPGDRCRSATDNLCESGSGSATYQPFAQNVIDAMACGQDARGAAVFCLPGDICEAENGRCLR